MDNIPRFTRCIININYKNSECTFSGAFLLLYGKIVNDWGFPDSWTTGCGHATAGFKWIIRRFTKKGWQITPGRRVVDWCGG